MNRRATAIVLRSAAALGLLWGALGAVAIRNTRATRARAEEFLKDFTQFEVANATRNDVTPLLSKYHGKWRTYGPYPPACCGPESSIAEFVFDNHWQHWIFFKPLTRLVADIGINGNGVCDRSLSLLSFTKAPFGILVQEFPNAQQPSPFLARLNMFKTITTLTTSATPVQRAAAYSLDLNCLSKLAGCRDAREMAPGVWQNSREVAPGDWVSQWSD